VRLKEEANTVAKGGNAGESNSRGKGNALFRGELGTEKTVLLLAKSISREHQFSLMRKGAILLQLDIYIPSPSLGRKGSYEKRKSLGSPELWKKVFADLRKVAGSSPPEETSEKKLQRTKKENRLLLGKRERERNCASLRETGGGTRDKEGQREEKGPLPKKRRSKREQKNNGVLCTL